MKKRLIDSVISSSRNAAVHIDFNLKYVVSGNGKLSSYSRKAQRLEMNAKNDTESKVLDLSAGDAITKLMLSPSC